jgi:hypothetical protein
MTMSGRIYCVSLSLCHSAPTGVQGWSMNNRVRLADICICTGPGCDAARPRLSIFSCVLKHIGGN